jgi:hypothetical protein
MTMTPSECGCPFSRGALQPWPLGLDGDPGAGEGPRAQVRRFSLYILCIYTRELERTKLLTGGREVVFLKR